MSEISGVVATSILLNQVLIGTFMCNMECDRSLSQSDLKCKDFLGIGNIQWDLDYLGLRIGSWHILFF